MAQRRSEKSLFTDPKATKKKVRAVLKEGVSQPRFGIGSQESCSPSRQGTGAGGGNRETGRPNGRHHAPTVPKLLPAPLTGGHSSTGQRLCPLQRLKCSRPHTAEVTWAGAVHHRAVRPDPTDAGPRTSPGTGSNVTTALPPQ
jgi:hypothetical protein